MKISKENFCKELKGRVVDNVEIEVFNSKVKITGNLEGVYYHVENKNLENEYLNLKIRVIENEGLIEKADLNFSDFSKIEFVDLSEDSDYLIYNCNKITIKIKKGKNIK